MYFTNMLSMYLLLKKGYKLANCNLPLDDRCICIYCTMNTSVRKSTDRTFDLPATNMYTFDHTI